MTNCEISRAGSFSRPPCLGRFKHWVYLFLRMFAFELFVAPTGNDGRVRP